MTRRTADSITDDELDALYAELTRLRDAAENAAVRPPGGLNPRAATNAPSGTENAAQTGTHGAASAPHPAGEDRRQRYAAAITAGGSCVDLAAATRAVLAVADAEQADLRHQLTRLQSAARLLMRNLNRADAALARARAECDAIDHLHLYGHYDATHICRTIADRIRTALDTRQAGDDTTEETP